MLTAVITFLVTFGAVFAWLLYRDSCNHKRRIREQKRIQHQFAKAQWELRNGHPEEFFRLHWQASERSRQYWKQMQVK